MRRYRFVHVSPLAAGVCVVVAVSWLWSRPRHGAPWLALLVALGVVVASFQSLNLALLPAKALIRRFANAALAVLLLLLATHRMTTGFAPDFFLIAENAGELFHGESAAMLLGAPPAAVTVSLALSLLALIYAAIRTTWLESWRRPVRRHPLLAASLLVLFVVSLSPAYHFSDLAVLSRTAFDYATSRHRTAPIDSPLDYPYVQRGRSVRPTTPPHIILLMMESFNAGFVERGVTPTFDSKIDDGLYVERFYGNSIQTARGQLAALCSVPPGIWRKVATHRPELRLHCLPRLLEQLGYGTWFFQGGRSLSFDNSTSFLARLGFAHARGFEPSVDDDGGNTWGVSDRSLFERSFAELDAARACESEPCFVTLATISHHFPFDRTARRLHPEPQNRREHFENSLHEADRQLATFFAAIARRPHLHDAVVVITADHGFPAGEHGNFFNERGFFEESFRVPLLVLAPGRIAPQRIPGPFRQLDLAPTLLELIEADVDHHLTGVSMLAHRASPNAIPLIQPYDGTHLGAIRHPLKYVRSQRVPGEYLFDLSRDPFEQHNIIESHRNDAKLAQLQQDVVRLQLNERLLDENRIWPSNR